jgi:hypothetical protein
MQGLLWVGLCFCLRLFFLVDNLMKQALGWVMGFQLVASCAPYWNQLDQKSIFGQNIYIFYG